MLLLYRIHFEFELLHPVPLLVPLLLWIEAGEELLRQMLVPDTFYSEFKLLYPVPLLVPPSSWIQASGELVRPMLLPVQIHPEFELLYPVPLSSWIQAYGGTNLTNASALSDPL